MKTCTKCGESKVVGEFSKCARSREGLTSTCKLCTSAYSAKYRVENIDLLTARDAAWYAANTEKKREANAAWRAANPEQVKVDQVKWRAANPEKTRAYRLKYYAENSDAVKAYAAAHRAANPDKVKADNATYYAANSEKMKAAAAQWQTTNPEAQRIIKQNRRARKAENGGTLSKGLAKRLFKLQRGKCPCCGDPLGEDYHLDHIMPLALDGPNEDWNMQLLRATCNQQKHTTHPVDFMQSRGFLL